MITLRAKRKEGPMKDKNKKDRYHKEKLELDGNGWKVDTGTEKLTVDFLFSIPPYVETKDESGSSHVGCRIPDYLARVLTSIKENNRSIYQILSDVVRDCLYVGIHVRLYQYGMEANSKLNVEMTKVLQAAQEYRGVCNRFQAFCDEAAFMMEHGETTKAVEHFSSIAIAMSNCDDPWLRGVYMKLVKDNRVTKELIEKSPKAIRDLFEE